MRLYLSPSNQPRNSYAVGGTNEKEQMEAMVKLVKKKMEAYEVSTRLATLSMHIGKTGRATEAKNTGCDFYEAYHSNAGGAGTGRGAVVFYNPAYPQSKKLAENIVAELNAITPHGENRASQVVNGMTQYDGQGMGEIRNPGLMGIPAVLIEVDFHDNPVTARYLIDNHEKISDALVIANVKTFGLKLKAVAAPKPVAPVVDLAQGIVKVIYDGKDGLNARREPSFGDNVDHVVFEGEVFTVVGTVGDFYKLKSGLYISKNEKFVEFTEVPSIKPFKVIITANALYIREGVGITSRIVGSVQKGEVFTIVNKMHGWGELKSGAGWISLDFTAVVD